MREPVLPDGVPQPLDNELLAWAAGFFDGEGSTIAKTDARRPDYYQLDVSVPQSGSSGVPEVLTKFQRVMFGVGHIQPQHHDDMYKWDAGGRVPAEMALALMWPWLGDVKRTQALLALETVKSQYDSGRHRQSRPRYRPTFSPHDPRVPAADDRREGLAWAAGFLDAEGYFGLPRRYARANGSTGFVTRVSATQHGVHDVPAEVLTKLRRILAVGRIERHGEPDDFKWVAEGITNVRTVLDSLRPWLGSVKTNQAVAALEKAESSRVRGDAEHCLRGHVYDDVYLRPDGRIHRRCNACARMNERTKRMKAGSKPRQVKIVSTDPSRIYGA